MNWFHNPTKTVPSVSKSILYDETTFYNQFTQDLEKADKVVNEIEDLIDGKRLNKLANLFK